MKVLFVANEVEPDAKVGGLGDVAIAAAGWPTAPAGAVVMPLHRSAAGTAPASALRGWRWTGGRSITAR